MTVEPTLHYLRHRRHPLYHYLEDAPLSADGDWRPLCGQKIAADDLDIYYAQSLDLPAEACQMCQRVWDRRGIAREGP